MASTTKRTKTRRRTERLSQTRRSALAECRFILAFQSPLGVVARVPRSRDGERSRARDNRVTVNLDEPLSPELVLVAPPELAAYARRLLPEKPFPLPAPRVAEMSARFGFGFAGF